MRSTLETLCHAGIAVGALAAVIHSWILLSNGKSREALGAVIAIVLGAVCSMLFLEQWLAAAQAGIHAVGFLWGRVDRAREAQEIGTHAVVGAILYALLRFAAPYAMGFGYPAAGLETQMMWASFYLFLVNHSLRIPDRLSIAWQAATVARSGAPGSLPPVGGA